MEGLRIAPVLRKSEKVPHNTLKCELEGTDLCRVWALIRNGESRDVHYLTIDEISALGIEQSHLDAIYKQTLESANWVYAEDGVVYKADLTVREEHSSPFMIYNLSNEEMVEGAVLLSFSEIRKKIISNYPEYRVIMPSSIHDIVFYHKDSLGCGIEELKKIVRSVNASDAVQDSEILSNEVFYLKDDGSLMML